MGKLLALSLERKVNFRNICQDPENFEKALKEINYLVKKQRESRELNKQLFSSKIEEITNYGVLQQAANIDKKQSTLKLRTITSVVKDNQENNSIYKFSLIPQQLGDLFYLVLDLEKENNYHGGAVKIVQRRTLVKQYEDDKLDVCDERPFIDHIPLFSPQSIEKTNNFYAQTTETHNNTEFISGPSKYTRVTSNGQEVDFQKSVEKNNIRMSTLHQSKNFLQLNSNENELLSHLSPERSRILLSPAGSTKHLLQLNSVGQDEDFNQHIERSNTLLSLKGSTKNVFQSHVFIDTQQEIISPVNPTKPLDRVDAFATSSVGSTNKASSLKLEQTAYIIPKAESVRVFYYILLAIIFVSSALLLAFNFKSNQTISLVESSVEVISRSIFRLVRITDIGQYVRNVWQAEIGLYNVDRYSFLGWPETPLQINLDEIFVIVADLNHKNNGLRDFIYKLDSQLQDQMYRDKIAVYEMTLNGSIETNRVSNSFDLVTELVSQGTKYATSGLPANKDNPYLLFVLNNTFYNLIVPSERIIPILIEDNHTKLTSQMESLYIMLSCLGVFGICIIGFLISIERNFSKDRNQFISIFLTLDDKQILTNVHRVEEFLASLTGNFSNLKRFQSKQISLRFEARYSVKGKNVKIKKTANSKGVNTPLVLIFLKTLLLLILLLSAFIVLLTSVNSKGNDVLTKDEFNGTFKSKFI